MGWVTTAAKYSDFQRLLQRPRGTLYTIPFSHYCELARWSLDAARIRYDEVKSLPGFHMVAGASVPGPRRSGSRCATPTLVVGEDDMVIRDSHEIAKFCAKNYAQALYPMALRSDIDDDLLHFHDALGPSTRRFAYYHLFQHFDGRDAAQLGAANGVPAWQTMAVRVPGVYAAGRLAIKRGLGVNRARAARAEGHILGELDAVARRRKGKFLHGDRITLADMSFASLMLPALGVPPELMPPGVALPPPDALGEHFARQSERFRDHDAGRFALEVLSYRPRGLDRDSPW
ncbi:hypothetical protein M885DRAFT_617198 [Pelagophyceae sp. CCMP2097]|nr:hypothetical protein M885DRAFT_617198 [Pelagophyceae sp. CCMP2097]